MAVPTGTTVASLYSSHKAMGIAPGQHEDNPDPFGTWMRSYNPNKSGKKLAAVVPGTKLVLPDYKTMLASDPRHIEFTYIKAADGSGGSYPTDPYYIQAARAALSAGIGFGPYLYFYMDGGAQVMKDQANNLYNSILACYGGDKKLFGTMNPIIDLEDNLSVTYKSMAWNLDPNTLAHAQANIKYFFQTLLPLAMTTIDNVFSANLGRAVVTQLYSGSWFIKPVFDTLKMGNWPDNLNTIKWYNNRMSLNASYSADHLPFVPPAAQLIEGFTPAVLQYTSTAVPPLVGLNVPGRDGVMGSSADLNVYIGAPEHFGYYITSDIVKPPVIPGDVPPAPPPDDDLAVRVKSLEIEAADLQGKIDHINARLAGIDNYLTGYKP